MSELARVLRHLPALAPHIEEDSGVDAHHYEEGQQVENSPEHQIAAAVHWRHRRAHIQVTQAAPAHAGNQAHDDCHQPDEEYDDENPPFAHLTVQQHVEDGLVALNGHRQQVQDRSCEAGVDQ